MTEINGEISEIGCEIDKALETNSSKKVKNMEKGIILLMEI